MSESGLLESRKDCRCQFGTVRREDGRCVYLKDCPYSVSTWRRATIASLVDRKLSAGGNGNNNDCNKPIIFFRG